MARFPWKPQPGLFMDETDFDSPGLIVDCINVRPYRGRWQVINGWTTRSVSPGSANAILQWRTSDGTERSVYGMSNSLKVQVGAGLSTITPTGSFSGSVWRFANWGDDLLACYSGAKLYRWALNTAVVAAEVTAAPDQITDLIVDPVRRQALALGCNEEVSGTFNGRCIRGCDFENIDNWTTASNNNAFEQILDGATSDIVGGRMVGGFPVVWTRTEMFVGLFVGDPGQTWRFERVGVNCGLFAIRLVAVAGDTAYWMTPFEQFMAYTPGGQPTPIPCPILDYVNGQIGTAKVTTPREMFASYVPKFDEVWFSYPVPPAQERYFAFCRSDPRLWFKGIHRRTAMEAGITDLVATLGTGDAVNCEVGNAGTSGHGLAWSMTGAPEYVDEAERGLFIRGCWPDFEDQVGDISLVIKTREYPQGSETTWPTATLAVSEDKEDFRVSGKMAAITLSGGNDASTAATYMRLGKLIFDGEVTGER